MVHGSVLIKHTEAKYEYGCGCNYFPKAYYLRRPQLVPLISFWHAGLVKYQCVLKRVLKVPIPKTTPTFYTYWAMYHYRPVELGPEANLELHSTRDVPHWRGR